MIYFYIKPFIIVVCLLLSTIRYAQIYGNGKPSTTTITLSGLEELDIQFNADITLDYSAFETIAITAEENIIKYIGQNFIARRLALDQIKWREPSKNPKIVIGTPKPKENISGHSWFYLYH